MRAGRRLVEDFLVPALNEQKYGDLLKWEDKEKLHFSIRWSHKNAAKWSLNDTKVFQDWDRMKGHFHPEIKGYYMQAKQRFRAALYKLSTVKKLKSEDKHVKKYQLVDKYQLMLENRRKKQEELIEFNGIIKEEPVTTDESQKCIPTAVICWNDGHGSPIILQKVLQSSACNYTIPNSHNSGGEILDYSYHSSPSLPQENHVTSVQEQHLQHFVKIKPEMSCISPSDSSSLTNGLSRNIPDCSSDPELERSKEFFAQLNLVKVGSVRTSKPAENNYLPNKRLCISSCKPTVLKSSEEELENKFSNETSNINDAVADLRNSAPEPHEPPFSEYEDKNLNKPNRAAVSAVGPLSRSENCLLSEVITPVCSAVCMPKCRVKPELSQRKLTYVSRKASGSPHVPIPPLPGYSKSSVIPRRTEVQHNAFLIKDHLVVRKTASGTSNKTVWPGTDSIPYIDGPLNLSTKPDSHYKSESPVFTDR